MSIDSNHLRHITLQLGSQEARLRESLRVLRALFGSDRPDHPEHVHGWGHPEFAALLQRSGFVVDAWYKDRVSINPLHGRFGQTLTRLLEPLEVRLLPRLLPMLSSSLIVRCHLFDEDTAE